MRYDTTHMFVLLALSAAALVTSACGGAEEASASYDLVVQDRVGGEYVYKGDNPSCKVNTSFPEGDPKRGKFFVGQSGETADGALVSLYVHFLDYTEPPPAGTYSNSDPMVDISFSTDFPDDSVDVADDERDLSNTSVTVTDGGDGIRMTLDAGFPGASGYIQCAP